MSLLDHAALEQARRRAGVLPTELARQAHMPPDTATAFSERGTDDHKGIQLAERPGQRRRGDYPWEHWQAGGWRVVRHGRDFDCTIEGMRSTLLTRAKRDDIAIEVIRNPQAPEIPPSRSRLYLAFCFHPGRSYADGPDPAAF